MIILHSEHDKASREFVSLYGEGHTVLNYQESIQNYSNISAFPSVVINVPAHIVPEQYIEEEIMEAYTDPEGNYHEAQTIPAHTIPSYAVEAHTELMRMPSTMQEAIDYQNKVNSLAE